VLVMFAVGLLVGYRPTTNVLYLVGGIALLLLISFAFSWVSAATACSSGGSGVECSEA